MSKHIASSEEFMRLLVVVIALVCVQVPAVGFAQEIPPIRLVDAPTAGTLPGKSVFLESYLYDGGGVVQSLDAGVIDLIDIGCSYGGSGIVGAGKIVWQPHVAFHCKVRLVEETLGTPAIAIGFDSQGFGPYVRGHGFNRFRTKSRGVYVVVSRNYGLLGDIGLHGGANYSLETDDGEKDPSFWAGIDKSVGKQIVLCGEYDFATNDNGDNDFTKNRGYLNCAVRWNFGGGFMLELDVRNLLRNSRRDISGMIDDRPEPSRELRFGYCHRF